MIFNSITLKNFRQYRDVTINFATDDKDITLLVARNGVGKTTLLQAFRFCFYGESPNYLKLANPEHLLNYTAEHNLKRGYSETVSVDIQFSHAGEKYVARRTLSFMKQYLKTELKGKSDFILLREDGTGYTKVDGASELMNQIMPAGLAHVFMFDGERMEKRVETHEYKKDLQDAITGVLGLKEIEKAIYLLGDTNKRNSVIGTVAKKLRTNTVQERQLSEDAEAWKRKREDNLKKIQMKQGLLQTLDARIVEVEELIQRTKEAEKAVTDKRSLDSDLTVAEQSYNQQVASGIGLQSKILFLLELKKCKDHFEQFMATGVDDGDGFNNLHEDVIKVIIEKGICICGRPVEEHSAELKRLLSLATLPNDNSPYIKGMNSLFRQINDLPALFLELDRSREQVNRLSMRIRELAIKLEEAEKKVEGLQEDMDLLQNVPDLGELTRSKRENTQMIKQAKMENEQLDEKLSCVEFKLRRIRDNDKYNSRVMFAIDELNKTSSWLNRRLKIVQSASREEIEGNMNDAVGSMMEGNLRAKLSSDYELTIEKTVKSEEFNETGVLSTGQSVMISLSFLVALLKTLKDQKKDETYNGRRDNRNAVVMDAALSNVDEKHIRLASDKVLTQFDQLIFMSFKRQLRKELYSGIKKNVARAYEMKKDLDGNVEVIEIPMYQLSDYIESGDEI